MQEGESPPAGIKMGGNKDRRINIPFEVCFCLLRRRIGPEHKKCA